MPWREVPAFVTAQTAALFAGVAGAHVVFGEPVFAASTYERAGAAQGFSEFVATFGLLAVIWGCSRLRSSAVPFAVGAYITASYWFTASTSFANPRLRWRVRRRIRSRGSALQMSRLTPLRSFSARRVREIRDEVRGLVWKLLAKEAWWKLRPAPPEPK